MMIFEVFSRKNRGEPLRHIGSVNAPDASLARVYAYQTYDEDRWFDMWIVPRGEMLEVFNREADEGTDWWQEFADAEAPGAVA